MVFCFVSTCPVDFVSPQTTTRVLSITRTHCVAFAVWNHVVLAVAISTKTQVSILRCSVSRFRKIYQNCYISLTDIIFLTLYILHMAETKTFYLFQHLRCKISFKMKSTNKKKKFTMRQNMFVPVSTFLADKFTIIGSDRWQTDSDWQISPFHQTINIAANETLWKRVKNGNAQCI